MSKVIFKEMLFPATHDILFETEHALMSEGYTQEHRASNFYEDIYKDKLNNYYTVSEADNEEDYIIIELQAI